MNEMGQKIWYTTDKNGNSIVLTMYANGHLNLNMDFVKGISEEGVWRFIQERELTIDKGSYKKPPALTVVKEDQPVEPEQIVASILPPVRPRPVLKIVK
jgi:hypothetical protein